MHIHLKSAMLKAAIVLVPSYTAAFLTEKMVYVVPTLAAAGFFASTLDLGGGRSLNRLDEDADDTTDSPTDADDSG